MDIRDILDSFYFVLALVTIMIMITNLQLGSILALMLIVLYIPFAVWLKIFR